MWLRFFRIQCDVDGCEASEDVCIPGSALESKYLPVGWFSWSSPKHVRHCCGSKDCTDHAKEVMEIERLQRVAERKGTDGTS